MIAHKWRRHCTPAVREAARLFSQVVDLHEASAQRRTFLKNAEKNRPVLERCTDATRQYIDAVTTFEVFEEAMAEAAQMRGGMYVLAQGPGLGS